MSTQSPRRNLCECQNTIGSSQTGHHAQRHVAAEHRYHIQCAKRGRRGQSRMISAIARQNLTNRHVYAIHTHVQPGNLHIIKSNSSLLGIVKRLFQLMGSNQNVLFPLVYRLLPFGVEWQNILANLLSSIISRWYKYIFCYSTILSRLVNIFRSSLVAFWYELFLP